MKIPRILLTAGASGSGKTLITCGLLEAFQRRGLNVAAFKCGPDYIDPMFHSRVIGTKSRNLDTFFTSKERTRYLFSVNAANSDLAVMEGVMGYYDGVAGTTVRASAYDLADTTDTPAILIVGSRGMSVSLCAYIKGFLEYKENSHIKGVIFNQMSPMLYPRMKELVEQELSVKVLGYVPKVEDCVIESRHLGLVLPEEIPELKEKLGRLAGILEKTLDIDGILKLAEQASDINDFKETAENICVQDPAFAYRTDKKVRIGVADDEAFCFFYEDNFRLLREMGAELISFSPIYDRHLPENLDGLLLYGGYPELYGTELEKNQSMREEIRTALISGLPCMAECGGFMYLHDALEDMNGELHTMVGVVSGKAFRTGKLTRFGYVTLTEKEAENVNIRSFSKEPLGEIPAHEFHYFDSEQNGSAFHASKPESRYGWDCMHISDSMLIGFPHLYYYGNPRVPAAFLQKCAEYREKRNT